MAWYTDRFGEEPQYGGVLARASATLADRQALLRGFFEPSEEEHEGCQKVPTEAHRAIARLVANRHVRMVITTNFDRLLEQALTDAGVAPSFISSVDALGGAARYAHARCVLLKVRGDYLDARIGTRQQSWPPIR